VTRRRLLGTLAVVAATPLWLVLRRLPGVPPHVVAALQPRAYPGRIRPLDAERVARPAHWAG